MGDKFDDFSYSLDKKTFEQALKLKQELKDEKKLASQDLSQYKVITSQLFK